MVVRTREDSAGEADAPDAAYLARMRDAYLDFQRRSFPDRVSDAEIARRMQAVDRSLDLTHVQVRRIINGQRPRRETLAAFAAVIGVDPGWLDYGAQSGAPAPAFTGPATAPRAPMETLRHIAPADADRHAANARPSTRRPKGR